ncbi:C2 domain-containing protein [Cladochytrium replicatum]|nr:C2 domain-containing protein [Cladochytrium replicatum]
MVAGFLHVFVVSGANLKDSDLIGKSDPYVLFTLDHDKHSSVRTSTKGGTLDPVWNEELTILVNNHKKLHIQVFDDDPMKDDKIGSHEIDLTPEFVASIRGEQFRSY